MPIISTAKGKDMDYKVIKSKRKTIALTVTEDAQLIVKAPFYVSEETIKQVILKHRRWIEKRKREINSRAKYKPKEFVNGEGFLYLGKWYKLFIVEEQLEPLRFENGFYLSKTALPHAKKVFLDWYKRSAYEKISERVEFYAKKRGITYNKIKISNAMRRWGSCSSRGNLNFSWRLIMAPLSVIDYVVVHELAHIIERNHSKRFWNIVKIMMPDYKIQSKWLKDFGYLLRIE